MRSSAVEILKAAAGRNVVDEDGNDEVIRLLPPLSEDELKRLQARIPCPLPADARELLTFARGFEGGLESIDFSGLDDPIFEELFPCGLPIAHDGYGNYWVVDLVSTTMHWGPVLYVCHDPPVIVYQCEEIATFISDVLRMAEAPWDGPIDDVHERYSMRIWSENPGVLPRDDALRSTDEVLRRFAEQLTTDHFISDLRNGKTGDGFSWGRFGPQTPVIRAAEARVFAYQKVSRGSRLKRFFTGR